VELRQIAPIHRSSGLTGKFHGSSSYLITVRVGIWVSLENFVSGFTTTYTLARSRPELLAATNE
jgi:hypothetical protein